MKKLDSETKKLIIINWVGLVLAPFLALYNQHIGHPIFSGLLYTLFGMETLFFLMFILSRDSDKNEKSQKNKINI